MEGVEGWLRVVHAPGVGPVRTRELLDRFGSPAGFTAASRDQLAAARIPTPAIEVLQGRTTPAGIERDLEWAAADPARHLIPLDDPRYPPALAGIGDPPPVLYVQGDPEVLSLPGLAVVGTRHPTPSGRETAYDFAHHLGAAGLVIASGMIASLATGVVVDLYSTDPTQATTVWLAVSPVIDGLGGGNEIIGGLWTLLVSVAALRARALHRLVNYFGLVVGTAGILSAIPALGEIGGGIFGLTQIVWFVALGVLLLGAGRREASAYLREE